MASTSIASTCARPFAALRPDIARRLVQQHADLSGKVQVRKIKLPTAMPAADSLELCRQARKLRAAYEHDRVKLHQELGRLTLSDRTVPQPVIVNRVSRWDRLWRFLGLIAEMARSEPSEAAKPQIATDEFRLRVEQALAGSSVLRYSQRLELLAEAAESGINRFDANLLIASVEHQLTNLPAMPEKKSGLVSRCRLMRA